MIIFKSYKLIYFRNNSFLHILNIYWSVGSKYQLTIFHLKTVQDLGTSSIERDAAQIFEVVAELHLKVSQIGFLLIQILWKPDKWSDSCRS